MIKFFRHIRKKLLSQNRFTKYLLYAIGEIVLVVIGIIIALQINNWNETKKANQLEQLYLKNILSDLKDQNASIEIQLNYEERFFKAAGSIIEKHEQKNHLIIDSIFSKKTTILTSRKTFVITDPTYTDLISSGNIKLIKSFSLKDKLIKYYQELERIEKVIQSNNTFLVDQYYLPTFKKYSYYYEPNILEIYPKSIKKNQHMIIPKHKKKLQEISKNLLLTDEHFLAFINALYLRNTVAIGNYELLKTVQSTTQSLIKEIEHPAND